MKKKMILVEKEKKIVVLESENKHGFGFQKQKLIWNSYLSRRSACCFKIVSSR